MNARRILKRGLWILPAAIAVYILLTTLSIVKYSDVDEKQSADAAIVLGAGSAGGEVSLVFRERINHGIWLYQNGYVKKLIFTGGTGRGQQISDAYAAMQYAVEQGVPESAILLEETSKITLENVENAKKIMDERSLKTAIIVSDPLHMKRAMLMAQDCGIAAFSSPTPTTRYMSWKTKLSFLCREEFFYVGYRLYRLF